MEESLIYFLTRKKEEISGKVHDAWWDEKKVQGFHAPRDCDQTDLGCENQFRRFCDKCHSDMYPFNELPENIKDYDRVTVQAVIDACREIEEQ